jgi:hypothetical protein
MKKELEIKFGLNIKSKYLVFKKFKIKLKIIN